MPTSLGLFGTLGRGIDERDPEAAHTARALHALLVTLATAIALFLALGIPLFIIRKQVAAAGCVPALVILLIALLQLRRRRIRPAAWTFVAGSWLIVTAWMVVTGGMRSPGYVVVIVAAAWVLGQRAALWMAALSIFAGVGIAIGETAGRLPLFPLTLPAFTSFSLLVVGILLTAVPASQVLLPGCDVPRR